MGGMDWQGGVERDRNVLGRILALLLALAALADRAAGLPLPDRLRVLAILGRGEAEARCFVAGMALGAPVQVAAEASPAPGDARRLAASFRALALVLGAMLARPRRFARSHAREAGAQAGSPMRGAAEPCWRRAVAAWPAPDTS